MIFELQLVFFGKVFADLVPWCSQRRRKAPISRLMGQRRLKMPFFLSILATLLPASPASSSKLAPLCAHISKDLSPWPIAQIRSTILWFLGRLINATRRTRADLASSENITEGVTRPSIMAAVRILVEHSEVALGRRCGFYRVALNDVMVTT